jgi:hypothetical protein
MIDELLERATQLRNDAQDLRRQARKETCQKERDRLFNAAAAQFQMAITVLKRGLRAVRSQQDEYAKDACRVLEALSQSYGSLGGTWRDAGGLRNRELARELYDQGNEYEEERRRNCSAKDTYNMLQRLIIRLLIKNELIGESDFLADLNAARTEIERQVAKGRDDSWALADLALVRFLCGIEADTVIADLERRKAEATFYESAYNAVAALVDEGLGKGKDLGDRLEAFKRLLQRKGGIA